MGAFESMSVFPTPERQFDFPAHEKKWLAFWKERDIFAKQLARSRERAAARPAGERSFVFYEGPPTANGMPHPGHVLTRAIKDLFPRFRAMQGFDVPRKAGWDTHGLPVEIEVEKELGIEGKPGIERYGVESFIKRCRDSVFNYSAAWSELTERLGFWVDLDDPYVTYRREYVESVWWSLKALWDGGMIHHGHKIVPWCPRCGTALSSHEVGLGYKETADPSAFAAFRSADDPKTLFVAWTTTPWTLLSNVALAVGADFDYDFVRVESAGETLVLASALRASVLGKIPHEVVRTVKGRQLAGKTYEPLYAFVKPEKPCWKVIAGDFVGLDAGTGIVHIAPAFGEDDYRAGRENDLPLVNVVNPDGTFMDCVTPWAGTFVKAADPLILKDLRARGHLLKSETYKHEYPFCWRCPSPLLYYPRPAWYIRTSEIKDEMLANNAKVGWFPGHIRDGRFGNFLASNVDWALSRERYWGTPLPIWRCENSDCGWADAVGSLAELRSRAANPEVLDEAPAGIDARAARDLVIHKPHVDRVALPCPKCGGTARRVSEVIDCWYDSGAMPFAQWGYPGKAGSGEALSSSFPADFISEAIDQTRGWFYSLLSIATLLKRCAEKRKRETGDAGDLAPWLAEYPLPYRRCLVLGLLLAQDGQKLSKAKRNYPDPFEVFNKEGADALRWFFYVSNQPWTSTRFFSDGIREAHKDFLIRLHNVLSFFSIYANIDGFDPRATPEVPFASRPPLDRWLSGKLETLTADVAGRLEAMDVLGAAQALSAFVEQLSNWHVRRSRDRFWKPGWDDDKRAAYWTLYKALCRLSLLLAPFTPFYAEELHQTLTRGLSADAEESVHLCDWPSARLENVDREVETRMDRVREIASLGLSARGARKLKVRQPLAKAIVILADPSPAARAGVEALADVVRDELNVKSLEFSDAAETYVTFSVKPNFKTLGSRLAADMKACAAAVAAMDAAALARRLRAEGRAEVRFAGRTETFDAADFEIRLTAKDGFAAADGRVGVVVIDAAITDELFREGLARELVNRIQNLRKDLDLPYQARIAVALGTGGAPARAAAEHRAAIAAETLADDFRLEFSPLDRTVEFELAGEPVRLSIKTLADR